MSPFTIPPVLIFSTGRCGSTMISELLNRHPAVLSLSEFLVLLGQEAFAHRRPTGAEMWRVYSRQSPALRAMMQGGKVMDEVLYPLGTPGTRFHAEDIPPIALVTLPHLTDQHEALFDELAGTVGALPRMDLAAHYQSVFDHLGRKFNRRVWVERSGGSLMYARKLLKLFPDARVIHVFRDGRDTAMSMTSHPNFRILVAMIEASRRLGLDLYRKFERADANMFEVRMEQLFFRLVDTPKLAAKATLPQFGAFWSRLTLIGQETFSTLPPERVLNLRFEELQDNPREMLDRMIRFIDPSLADKEWLDAAAAVPRPTQKKYKTLPPEEQRALTEACAPGLAALGYTI
ncbi:MAG TPA: sulfotransferase [Alphaproteobacteria bacterium]|jgi:hypothetical protein|nr:sulfotransferase [Alphaproteobacteria bacterium]